MEQGILVWEHGIFPVESEINTDEVFGTKAIAAIDMCGVPTLTFDRLFAFLVLGHGDTCVRPPCPISIANNPVGELKMPTLQNPRHEKFAQELAAGKSAAEAYAHCGYKPNYGNCIRLKGFKGSRLAWQSYNTVALLALR